MGEARQRKLERQAAREAAGGVDVERAAAAMRQVVGAVTDFNGADCLLYAHVGAELLRSLGLDARAVAGSAVWRVGDGDSDVISHAREINGMQFSQAGEAPAAMFHAWIEAPGLVIDFSTWTLREKAAQLDTADGGSTTVDWCPPFLWGPVESQARNPLDVLRAPHAGAFSYVRHADVEAIVLRPSPDFVRELGPLIFASQAAYAALGRGGKLRIIGVGADGGGQEEPAEKPLRPFPRA
jgi:hypothetical protein